MYTLTFTNSERLIISYDQLSRSKTLLNMINDCDDDQEIKIPDIIDKHILKQLLIANKIPKDISHDKLSTVIDFFDIDHDLQLILTLLDHYCISELMRYFNINLKLVLDMLKDHFNTDLRLTNLVTDEELFDCLKKNQNEIICNCNNSLNQCEIYKNKELLRIDVVCPTLNYSNLIIQCRKFYYHCSIFFKPKIANYCFVDDIIKFGSKILYETDKGSSYQLIGCGFLSTDCENPVNCKNHRFLIHRKSMLNCKSIIAINLVDNTEVTINLPDEYIYYNFSPGGKYVMCKKDNETSCKLLDSQTNNVVISIDNVSQINLTDEYSYGFCPGRYNTMWKKCGIRTAQDIKLQANNTIYLADGIVYQFYNDTILIFHIDDNHTTKITCYSQNDTWSIICKDSEFFTYLPKRNLIVTAKSYRSDFILTFISKNSRSEIYTKCNIMYCIYRNFTDLEEHFLFIDNAKNYVIIDLETLKFAESGEKFTENIILFPKSLSPLAIDYARHKLSWKN